MKRLIWFIILLAPFYTFSQQWVDTLYTIQTDHDIIYGSGDSFMGTTVELKLDLSYPENDSIPFCGRPLLVMIHGGGWFAGDKAEGNAKRIREDFAKRGYVTASVNYRLGQFHTEQFINCNVPDWNCWNMTDTTEWYRANHRAVQDVNSAIRFLINNASEFQINPDNVFVSGESAGGFIAMGVGFIDDDSEVLSELITEIDDVDPPNELYEQNCIQSYNLAEDIASMELTRPNLGSYLGTSNLPLNEPFQIKAVGNFYGGAFNNIFQNLNGEYPDLYLFHQPCDLIVPFNYAKLLNGYNNCLMGFPANCQNIVNRPFVYGSNGIKTLIDQMASEGLNVPNYLLDNSNNNYNCLQQAADPSLGCHAIDNYWLRTNNMASFFAGRISNCEPSTIPNSKGDLNYFKIYPNPASDELTLKVGPGISNYSVSIICQTGEVVFYKNNITESDFTVNLDNFKNGIYIVKLNDTYKIQSKLLSIQK